MGQPLSPANHPRKPGKGYRVARGQEMQPEPNHSSENGATADTEAKEDPDASKGEEQGLNE